MKVPEPHHAMHTLVTAVQELSLARNIDTVMKIVRTAARELTGADGATFILRDGNQCFYADEDTISPLWKGSRFPMEHCISGWTMVNKQPAVIEDIYTDSRIPVEAYETTYVKSLAMVPIRTVDPIGAIGNYWAKQHLPTPEEVKILQALADLTSVTLENIKVYNELEQRVQDRTRELEEINRELEAFSYSVSHDLRAPLRAVNGYATIILENHGAQLDTEATRMMKKVIKNGAEMGELIDGLLDFFRMGRKELNKVRLSVKDLVDEVYRELSEREKGRSVNISIQELPPVEADPAMLKQVWVNLVSNALKYTSHKDLASINIGSEKKDGSVVYYIKDNGAGFDMQYYNKLFGVFQRLHAQNEFEGNGIGLALVDRIVSKHGGKVWAESKVDEGATFYFSLSS